MIMIRKKKSGSAVVIDLTGPDGNAYALMGYARKFAKELGISPDPILEDMQSSDYEHLVEVFNFGKENHSEITLDIRKVFTISKELKNKLYLESESI